MTHCLWPFEVFFSKWPPAKKWPPAAILDLIQPEIAHLIRRPRKPHSRTKHEVDRMTRWCWSSYGHLRFFTLGPDTGHWRPDIGHASVLYSVQCCYAVHWTDNNMFYENNRNHNVCRVYRVLVFPCRLICSLNASGLRFLHIEKRRMVKVLILPLSLSVKNLGIGLCIVDILMANVANLGFSITKTSKKVSTLYTLHTIASTTDNSIANLALNLLSSS